MALDKFINSVRSEAAKRHDFKTDAEIDAFFIGLEESAKDNQEALEKRDKMLRDTVEELCEAKRLLKQAVVDFSNMYDHIFDCDGMCDTCPIHGNRDTCDMWVRADIVQALLTNEPIVSYGVEVNNAVVKGEAEWSYRDDYGNPVPCHCTNCGCKAHTETGNAGCQTFTEDILSKFCPNCGARMIKEGDTNERS